MTDFIMFINQHVSEARALIPYTKVKDNQVDHERTCLRNMLNNDFEIDTLSEYIMIPNHFSYRQHIYPQNKTSGTTDIRNELRSRVSSYSMFLTHKNDIR